MICGVLYLYTLLFSAVAFGQFGMFDQFMRQQKQQQQQPDDADNWVESQYDKIKCDQYLCEDTLACVKSRADCPCLFPATEIKCVLPNKDYVCISSGSMDCSFVEKAYKGQV